MCSEAASSAEVAYDEMGEGISFLKTVNTLYTGTVTILPELTRHTGFLAAPQGGTSGKMAQNAGGLTHTPQ